MITPVKSVVCRLQIKFHHAFITNSRQNQEVLNTWSLKPVQQISLLRHTLVIDAVPKILIFHLRS